MRYYIHIPLPKKLKEKIAAIEFQYQGENKSEPHITLVPPLELLEGKSEQELINAINLVAEACPYPFPITQKKIGYFGNKDTIFIGVERSPELLKLHGALRQAVSGILEPPDGPFADLPTPHITLAAHLSPEQGERAWEELRNKDLRDQFVCGSVVLLRKSQADKCWQFAERFSF